MAFASVKTRKLLAQNLPGVGSPQKDDNAGNHTRHTFIVKHIVAGCTLSMAHADTYIEDDNTCTSRQHATSFEFGACIKTTGYSNISFLKVKVMPSAKCSAIFGLLVSIGST